MSTEFGRLLAEVLHSMDSGAVFEKLKAVMNIYEHNLKLEAEVEALKAEHRWISVSEPPKIDGTYLLRNTCTDVYSCNFIADTNTWVLSGYDSITHWMPLPQPPEVQE